MVEAVIKYFVVESVTKHSVLDYLVIDYLVTESVNECLVIEMELIYLYFIIQ